MGSFVFKTFLKDATFFGFKFFAMFLFDGLVLGIDVPEDEVKLGLGAALVGAEHDGIGGGVGELAEILVFAIRQQLDVATTAFLTIL